MRHLRNSGEEQVTRPEFQTLIASIRADQDKLLTEKGADYTQQSADVHHNFKIVAEQLGLTPLQVWAVYAEKHWIAIMSYVKHGSVSSEPIESRFRDLGNYLLLGEGLLPLVGANVQEICGELFYLNCGGPVIYKCDMSSKHSGFHGGPRANQQ